MRSAIDDLLADLDDGIEQKPAPVRAQASAPVAEVSAPKTRIDDLLEDLEDDYRIQSKPAPVIHSEKPVQSRTEKCFPTMIGGMQIPIGLTIGSQNARSCNMLRCTRCDIPVKRFENSTWSDDVNYLFFRNNYSRENLLREKLRSAYGWCAYSCQCTWRQTNQTIDLTHESWVCRGHRLN